MASTPRPGPTVAGRGEPPPPAAASTPQEREPGAAQAPPSLAEQFEALYAAFYPGILGYLTRLLGDREQAEDAAQDTFLNAWRHLGNLKPNSRLSSWLYRIARNRALDLLRRRALIGWQSLQGVDAEDDGQGQDFNRVEVASLLQQAYDLLPPQHKRTLALWQGRRQLDQLAALLHTTAETARVRLSRARRAWRQSYADLVPGDH